MRNKVVDKFINKYNISYESAEQMLDIRAEMMSGLDLILNDYHNYLIRNSINPFTSSDISRNVTNYLLSNNENN